ncbi:ABC transporter permease [Pseudooceanicola sp. CBS1P-1]|uniref:ABC transporter permease n=1 Tax=Pseudooceanicola albus TaxID=2692189 RepID=A0A6L7G9Q5_9RHOB|nr:MULTISPECIES: ABC transporter permease [Pseudooceanicola]MBT9386119.1 ABC transporter permease [Pseudooceanicola endophyticus]MXN19463.1 ABC transporter permease [Pseudooceanicola albus]
MIRKNLIPAWPLILAMVLFFTGPLVLLFGISLRGPDGSWGFGNFATFLSDGFSRKVLFDTLWLGLRVTALVSLVCLPLVMLYWHAGRRMRGLILIGTLLPMLTSNVVRTFAWVVLLGRNGPIGQSLAGLGLVERPISMLYTEPGLIIALVQIEMPFLLLPVFAVINRADRATLDAAETIGAGPWRAWFTTILPQILPAVLAGWVLVFAGATTSYVTQSVIGGARLIFLPQYVYRQVGVLFQWPMAATISILLLASTGLVMLALALLSRNERLQAHG